MEPPHVEVELSETSEEDEDALLDGFNAYMPKIDIDKIKEERDKALKNDMVEIDVDDAATDFLAS